MSFFPLLNACFCEGNPSSGCCRPTAEPLKATILERHGHYTIGLLYPDSEMAVIGHYATHEDARRAAHYNRWHII